MKRKSIIIHSFLLTFLSLALVIFIGCKNQNQLKETEYTIEQIQLGKQLINEGRCNFCHTPAADSYEGDISKNERLLSGHPSDQKINEMPKVVVGSQQWLEFVSNLDSTVWAADWGISFAANLTPDPATGIGNWTVDTFIKTMRTGKHAGIGRKLLPPMPWQDYAKLSDEELTSIFAYLRTVKPVVNKVPEPIILHK